MTAPFAHPLARARILVLALAIAPAFSLASGWRDGGLLLAGNGHAWMMSGMAAVALATAGYVSRAAWHRHDTRAALVASGFMATGALLLVHALATPGGPVFEDVTATVGVAGVMSMPIGAAFIAVAMSISSRACHTRRRVVHVQCATLAGTGVFAAVGLLAPHLIPAIPLMEAPYSTIVLAASIPTLIVAALRVHRVADITRRPADATMFAGIVTLAMAVATYVQSSPFDAQFWLGHGLEAIALTCICIGVAGDVRRPVSAWRLTMRDGHRDIVETSEELLGGYVHALTVRLAEIDPSTWHHSRRVAELAVLVGQELELDAVTIRRLASAGLVLDLGKLRIPPHLLHKAGNLTRDEHELIEGHPDFGVELLASLRGFDDELAIVQGHHEKLSGRGYPHGLQGDEIDLDTRILAVCDAYDSLTDARSGQGPWPPERALAMLHDEAGTSFDPQVVDAIERVVVRLGAVVPITAVPPSDAPTDLLDEPGELAA